MPVLNHQDVASTRAVRMNYALLACTTAIAVIISSQPVLSQTTNLPPLSVETKKQRAPAKRAARPQPKQAPVVATPTAPPEEVIETAAARDAAARAAAYNAPAGITVVGGAELDTFGSVRVDNVLRAQAGTFTRESVNQPGISVNIRGFEGMGRVNMMLDGARQNFRFLGHEASGFLYVDPQLLAGIDIQRGAISTAGGAGALSGSANFRTIGVEDIIMGGKDSGVLASATWGSNGVGWQEMVAAAARTDTAGVAAAISHRNQGLYKNGDGQTVPFGDQDLLSGLAKIYIKPTPGVRVDFGAVLYDNNFTSNSYEQDLKSNLFTGKFAYTPSDNPLVNFKLNAHYSDVRMEYLRGLNSFATSVGRIVEDRGTGFDVSNTSQFWLGAVAVKSTYGFEYQHDDFKVANGGVNPTGEMAVGGAFSETTFRYGMFDLIGGLRYDFFKIDGVTSVVRADPGAPLPIGTYDVNEEEGRVNPKLTLAARLTDWMKVYATYSESMRAPTPTEMLVGGEHPGGGSASYVANPFLKPEVQRGFEVGANFIGRNVLTSKDAFAMKVAYFRMNVEDYIVTCTNGAPSNSPAYVNWFCNAAGTTPVQGVEVQMDYDAGYAFAGLAYTYTNSDIEPQTPGNGASQYMPDHNLVLTGGVRLFDRALTLGARAYFVSDADDPSATATGGRRPGYELLDLFASYKIREGFDIGATVTNVLDEAYTPVLGTAPSSPNPFSPFAGETGRGRTFLLNTRIQF
jgi:hemoglobin/transferrin/lactoferrin receptor protein